MSDTDAAPRLGDSYMAYRDQASSEAAYAQMQARVAAGQQQATAGQAGAPPAQPATPGADQPSNTGEAKPAAAKPDADQQAMIDAEVQRLGQPPFDKSRYANPEEALRQRARANVGLPEMPAAPSGIERTGEVIKDIAYGSTIEQPRALYTGIHGAVRAVVKMGDSLNDWWNEHGGKAIDEFTGELTHKEGAGLFSGYGYLRGDELKAAEAAGAHELSASEALPGRIDDPRSVTGNIWRNVYQFAFGMRAAGSQIRALGVPTNLAGWQGRGVTAAQGFLSMFESFDGAQHRLSDLVQSVPALRNPVTDFLSSKPDDNEVEGRLKNALEGSVVAQAADGVMAGIKMLRGAYAARSAAQAVVDHASDAPAPTDRAGMEALGEPAETGTTVSFDPERWGIPASEMSAEQAKVLTATEDVEHAGATPEEVTGMKEPAAEPALKINFARIDTPDDIKNAMQNLADKFSDNIDLARRGVRTFQQTQLGAQAEDAWKILMERRVGQPLNDTESLAARQLWASSASKTMELAEIAAKAPTIENLYAFRKMLVTHAAIQEQVIAARTETARALASWRIPAGADAFRLERMVQQLSSDAGLKGGAETALTLAQKVHGMASAGEWSELSNFVEKTAFAKTRDAVLEGWTNGLLTAIGTHVKVGVSNAATAALRVVERATAARIDNALGSTDGVQIGEASAQVAGLIGGFKDAFRFAGKLARSAVSEDGQIQWPTAQLGVDPLSGAIKAAKTGQYSLEANAGAEYMQHAGAISSEAFGMADSGWAGKAVDLLGQLVRTPGRALTAEHDFFRSIGYRMELNAQATRQAIADVNAGRITQDALGDRIAEIIDNPPSSVKMASVNGALYQTFTDAPGALAQRIGELRNEYPLLRVIIPFYKIPSRIMSFTFERTPMAPFMKTFQQNFSAGGARQSLAVTQMGLGTAAMLATADAVLSGQVTGAGPRDPTTRAALENEGWQPYSIRVGNKWLQYNRIETVGSSMAMAADAVEAMRNFSSQVNGDDPDVANLGLATVAAIANDITSKSYLQGLSNLFDAIADPAGSGRKMIDALAGSIVPAGVASIDRVTDPYKREVYRTIDAIRARTPGLSEGLPPQRNLWGEPVQSGSGEGGAFDLFSPVGTRRAANEPIDRELIRQGISIARPKSRTGFEGVTLDLNRIDPKIYSRYQELAGNAYKGPDGLGLKDALNALVTGKHEYSPVYEQYGARGDGPDGNKADMIHDIVKEYHDGAKAQLLDEFPQLRDMVREGQAAKMQLKTGSVQ